MKNSQKCKIIIIWTWPCTNCSQCPWNRGQRTGKETGETGRIEAIQTTAQLKSARMFRSVLETWRDLLSQTSVKNHQLKLAWKNRRVKIMIIWWYTVIWFQVFQSYVNDLYTIICVQITDNNNLLKLIIASSNCWNNLNTVIWFQVFLYNTNIWAIHGTLTCSVTLDRNQLGSNGNELVVLHFSEMQNTPFLGEVVEVLPLFKWCSRRILGSMDGVIDSLKSCGT